MLEGLTERNGTTDSRQGCSWERPPEEPVIMDAEIHVWCTRFDRPDTRLRDMIALLSKDERARAERYQLERDFQLFILRRGLLRKILAGYLKVPADQLLFQTNEYGKPFLKNKIGNQSIFFNCSHANNLVLYAFSFSYEIGIDVAHIHSFSDMDNIVTRYFSLPERLEYNLLPRENRQYAFFRGWTCKEACLKAVGKGLNHGLECIQVILDPRQKAQLRNIDIDSINAADWSLEIIEPMPDYTAALSVDAKEDEYKCKYWKWVEH